MESRECFLSYLSYRKLFYLSIYLSIYLSALILFPCRLYAENPPANETTPVADAPSTAPIQDKDTPPPSVKPPKEEGATQTALMSADGSASGNLMNLPDVTTSSFTGAATVKIPIIVPPGRGGIAPNLNLTYSNTQNNGWVGVGWNLDMGAIQRATRFGVNYAANDYVAVVNGAVSELVPRGDWDIPGWLGFGAKIEGTFSKYLYNPTTKVWEVTAKNGTKYYYGSTPASRQDNGNDNTIFKWCLDKVQDLNGNYMTLLYFKDAGYGEIYLDRIDYTGNVNNTPLPTTNYVVFYREVRVGSFDNPDMYVPNFRVQTRYRLKTIGIWASGSLARAYTLSYTPSGSTSRSMLAAAYQYGSDAVIDPSGTITGGTALPATTFGWQTAAPSLLSAVEWANGLDLSVYGVGYFGFADFNNDGQPDFWEAMPNTQQIMVRLSTGSGFAQPTEWAYGNYWVSGWFGFTDFNNDGLADLWYVPGGTSRVMVRLSVGSGFNPATEWADANNWAGLGYFGFADINGDGKPDLWYVQAGTTQVMVRMSTGSGFNMAAIWASDGNNWAGLGWFGLTDLNSDGMADLWYVPAGTTQVMVRLATEGGPASPATQWANGNNWVGLGSFGFLDFNADGKADLWYVEAYTMNVRVGLSTGSGFAYANNWAIAVNLPVGLADFNGDGRPDLWYVPSGTSQVKIGLSTGAYFLTATEWANGNNWAGAGYFGFVDLSGDGKADLWYVPTTYAEVMVRSNPTPTADLLGTVSNGIGGSYAFEYAPSTQFANTYLPFPIQIVTASTANDGNGNISTTTYDYFYGFYDVLQREFRGFGYVKQTNPDLTTAERWFYQDNIYKGLMYKQEAKNTAGNLFVRSNNYFLSNSPYSGCYFPYLDAADSYLYDGTPTYKYTYALFDYDSYGNVTWKFNNGDSVVTGDEREDYIEYAYDTLRWIVSLPSSTYVRDYSSGLVKAQTWYDYFPGTTNLQTKEDWLEGGTNLITSFTYYAYGNLHTTTDPNLNVTTITSYDPTWTYPTGVTYPLSLTTSKTYDNKYGKPLTETDFNGNMITYQYDAFGRLTKVINPYDTTSPEGTQSFAYENFGLGVGQQRVATHITEQSGPDPNHVYYLWKENYFDGFGRTVKTRSEGPDFKVVVTQTQYNTMGRVSSSSRPFFENLETPQWVSFTYDPMGRLTQVTNPDDTFATKTYERGKTVMIDANGHKKEEDRDVYGRLVQVREYTGVNPTFTLYATTNYQYNTLDNLVQVTDNAGNVTSMGYDTLSRKTSMNDPDMGAWQYTYDANGDLRYQTDAKAQTIEFQYDALNRLTLKNYPTGTDVVYTYDEGFTPNYKGRLTTVNDASGTTKFYYDMLGRTIKTMKTVNSVEYTTETTYDAMSRVTSIKYPDNAIINYTYNSGGHLWQVIGYATFSSYNAAGQPGRVTYGNNVNTYYSYYPLNGRLSDLWTPKPSYISNFQDLHYVYDNAGNILSIVDLDYSSKTQNFQYDALDRLTQAQNTSYGTINYQYSPIGNMLTNSQVGTYDYLTNPFKPHAVSQAGSNTYHYDSNGNMDIRNGTAITYDYDNRPTIIGTNTFVYDYAGQRVKKNSTVYIGNIYECTGGTCTKYIFAGGRRVALKTGATVYYYHPDHLGGTNVVTSAAAVRVEEIAYYPYGASRYDTNPAITRHKYTGQEGDGETGLYYYGARYYDPTIGRFISADTIVQAPGDPQTLNRYSYVGNNPVIYTDPTGHCFEPFTASICAGIAIGAVVGGTVAAFTGGDVFQGMVTGAIAGGFFGAAGYYASMTEVFGAEAYSVLGAKFSALEQVSMHVAAGAASGGINAGIYGGDVGKGALYGGMLGGLSYSGTPAFTPFGDSLEGSIGNRLFNSSLTGGAFGAAYAGMTGGDVWRGATNSAMLWAAGEYANMYIGHMVGGMASGKAPTFQNGAFVYDADFSGWITFGNVITGPAADLKQPLYAGGIRDPFNRTYFDHELGHILQGTVLGPSYIPAHAASLTVGGLIGSFSGYGFVDGTHRFGFLERSWHPAPSW